MGGSALAILLLGGAVYLSNVDHTNIVEGVTAIAVANDKAILSKTSAAKMEKNISVTISKKKYPNVLKITKNKYVKSSDSLGDLDKPFAQENGKDFDRDVSLSEKALKVEREGSSKAKVYFDLPAAKLKELGLPEKPQEINIK